MRAWLLPLLLWAGCYQPDLSMVHYRCDGQNPTCPDGLTCIRQQCVDPAQGAGCLSQLGTRVGADAYACPGTFGRGHAADLCAPGYQPCLDGGGLDSRLCSGGFFASAAQAHRAASGAVCSAGQPGDVQLVLGCGALGGDTVLLPAPCSGFSVALDCQHAQDWVCGSGPDDSANQAYPDSGVLCCKVPGE